ncbi:MAG: hypothetical protein IJY95_01220 [Bacteroides sp.]|nr:hypothetical protein [Bacteroides sp.]
MIFDIQRPGAEELRELTGNYYANNDFNKIKSDIRSASYYLTKVIGEAVYVRAIDAYQKNEESGTGEGQIADVPKFIELVQRPIAIMATLQMYRKNDVSHEDSGRKVVVTSDGTDKIPWEWQLDRDDAIHMEEYYQAVEQLIDYLNKTQLKEWMESEQKRLADTLLIRSGREFDKYFPIQSSERMYLLMVGFIREVQMRYIRPAYGTEKWADLLADRSTPENEVRFAACKATALLSMSLALLRMPLQLIPGGVVRSYMSENGMRESLPASLDDVKRLASWLEQDAKDWIVQMKDLRDGNTGDISLLPENDRRNKFCLL